MGSHFVNAHKDGNGGGLLILSEMEGAVCKLLNVTFLDNKAFFGKGGAVYVEGNSLHFTLDSSNFSLNHADDIGSSIYASQRVIVHVDKTLFYSKITTQIIFPILSIHGHAKAMTANFKIDNMSPSLYDSP